jgi:sulfite reductase (NADPH) hemoprotein beta-component
LGHYNLYLGGSIVGDRMNILYKETLTEQEIINSLDLIFKSFAKERKNNESFGDYTIRKGIV